MESLSAEAAEFALIANTNKRAAELASIWIDLERYRALKELIDERLEILNPLIVKLEQVAEAGMGDIAQVSAAQRTVSIIKATQLEVSESLELAILDFQNSFGAVPSVTDYDSNFIDNLVPVSINSEMEQSSPALLLLGASVTRHVAAIEAEIRFLWDLRLEQRYPLVTVLLIGKSESVWFCKKQFTMGKL